MIVLCPARLYLYATVQVWAQLSLYFVLLTTSVRLRKAADYTWTQCSRSPEVLPRKAPGRRSASPERRGDKGYLSSKQRPAEARHDRRANTKGRRWRRQAASRPDWAHLPVHSYHSQARNQKGFVGFVRTPLLAAAYCTENQKHGTVAVHRFAIVERDGVTRSRPRGHVYHVYAYKVYMPRRRRGG